MSELTHLRLRRASCRVARLAAAWTLALIFALPAAAERQAPPPTGPVGAVAGRVTASGNPSVGALVTVLREHDPFNTGTPFLSPRDVRLVAATNRRGEYRLTNVPAGRYFLVALPPMTRVAPADRRGHAVTYYPGALESSESREITVDGGSSIEADIRLIPRRVSVISGGIEWAAAVERDRPAWIRSAAVRGRRDIALNFP